MKNIYALPTDKSSRLVKFFTNKFHLCKEILPIQDEEQYQHIYITNDSEIKEGDWYFWQMTKTIQKAKKDGLGRLPKFNDGSQKIILTTDQDLIKDGVQAIDDSFLEWFVNNPSCESVEVERGYLGMDGFVETNEPISKDKLEYKIIIPKEELKSFSDFSDKFFGSVPKEEPKHGTLEEAAERYSEGWGENDDVISFIAGAKWQAERMYSEEEVYRKLHNLMTDIKLYGVVINDDIDLKKWFEQFKKQ